MFQGLLNKIKTFKKGFTFIEIMMSVFIFSLVAAGLALPYIQSIDLTSKDQNIINANNLTRLYFNTVEIDWKQQINYDMGTLPTITSTYTNNGAYNVTVSKKDLIKDSSSNTIIRRVSVIYKDSNNKTLIDVYTDYNRP